MAITGEASGARRRVRMPSRRAVLGGGVALAAGTVGTVGVLTDALPGRTRLYTFLDVLLPVPTPEHTPGPVITGRFASRARRGADVGWLVAYPPASRDAGPLPVVLALHGQGGDASVVPALHLPGFLADAVAAGVAPFAIAAADGGLGYWHARLDGENAQAMLLEEFLPLLSGLSPVAGRRLAADPADRIGLMGWSAGGYGALLLAERLGPDRVAGVAAASPALWQRSSDTVDGAFDDAADFATHDVFAGRDRLTGMRVRVDCGRGDPFLSAAQAFAGGLTPAPAGGWGVGAHGAAYWQRLAADQLHFLGEALAPA